MTLKLTQACFTKLDPQQPELQKPKIPYRAGVIYSFAALASGVWCLGLSSLSLELLDM